MTYADTSFLVSVYVEDGNTKKAKGYFVEQPEPIFLTNFSRSEAQHAMRMLGFQKRIPFPEMTRALLQFERDEAEGFYEMIPFPSEDLFLKTSQLSHQYVLGFGLRYLDMLHIAAAVLIGAHRFLTFDLRQGKLAKAVGLEVKP